MAIKRCGTLSPYGAQFNSQTLANSITITVDDSVKAASGFLALGTGALVWGHVMGIGTKDGMGLNTTGVAGADIDSLELSLLLLTTKLLLR